MTIGDNLALEMVLYWREERGGTLRQLADAVIAAEPGCSKSKVRDVVFGLDRRYLSRPRQFPTARDNERWADEWRKALNHQGWPRGMDEWMEWQIKQWNSTWLRQAQISDRLAAALASVLGWI